MIDLDKLDADDRATFKVYITGSGNKDGDSKDASGFVVLGPNSQEYQKVSLKASAVAIKQSKGEALDLETDEGLEEARTRGQERAKLIAMACTVGMFGFESGNQPVAFSKEVLTAILEKRPVWAVRISNTVENEANFTKG